MKTHHKRGGKTSYELKEALATHISIKDEYSQYGLVLQASKKDIKNIVGINGQMAEIGKS